MRWVGIILLIIGFGCTLYADMSEQGAEGNQYSQTFWKRYTDALRGDKVAQFQVGVMYERGIDIEQNQTKALQWYEKSAAQGHMDAQYNAGIMYASGRGTKQNDGLAMMWLALAAQQGDKEARMLLLELVDGKIARKKSTPSSPSNPNHNATAAAEKTESIAPVTLICKENATVCTGYANSGTCEPYKMKSVVTSKEKKGSFYKISGIVTKKGWESYDKEGWIAEENVELRR
jgi:TPR repeat protein